MYRQVTKNIDKWFSSPNRKPLILRGARQVGKSTLVRQFAKSVGMNLIEVNLERHVHLDDVFKTLDPSLILNAILSLPKIKYVKDQSILFLDEIQATPHALAALRYFYEEMPELPVIAAGSLLEFVLEDHNFSMPVGRIQYLKMQPMTFEEFLVAMGEEKHIQAIHSMMTDLKMTSTLHKTLMDLLQYYLFTGGMPEAVKVFSQTRNIADVADVHESILDTYRDDFAKYARRQQLALLQRTLSYAAQSVGERVKYTEISRESLSRDVKHAVDLLEYAKVIKRVCHTDCSRLPLGVGVKEKVFKLLFLDVGLMNAANDLDFRAISETGDLSGLDGGKVAEQFVGQELAMNYDVYFWVRDGKAGNAELDYVISSGRKIIPIEVKSGKSGTLKSLEVFSQSKKPTFKVRFYANLPMRQQDLISLPLYAAGFLPTLLDKEN